MQPELAFSHDVVDVIGPTPFQAFVCSLVKAIPGEEP